MEERAEQHWGENLKRFREKKKISQERLARLAYIPRELLRKIEECGLPFDFQMIYKLADILNIKMFDLLKGDEHFELFLELARKHSLLEAIACERASGQLNIGKN